MDTQSNLSAQLNQQQNAAKMTKKSGGELGKQAGAAVGQIVGGKIAGQAMNFLPWFIAIVLDSYGLLDPYIMVLTAGTSEFVELPFDIGGGIASKELLKSHLSQAPELNKWILVVTGLKLVPFIDLFPWWITLMIVASYKIKQAKEQAQAEQEAKQKQTQIAQRRQAEWAAVA